MIRWMLKTLWLQKNSLFSSASGAAAAFILVIVLDAVFVGESHKIVAYTRNVNADIWVMQKGVSNMHMATSFVWDWKAKRIEEMPGVKKTASILYMNSVVKAGRKKWFLYVIGLHANDTRAGPWLMSSGKQHPEIGEIILPQVMADMTDIKIGDIAKIADTDFTIVGFSENTFSMVSSIAFVSFSDLEDLLETDGTVSFILVDIVPGQNPLDMARRIEQQVDKVTAIPQSQFIKNDFQLALLMGVEVISFMAIIGAMLAVLIIAFTMYSLVTRRKRELAILKALGVKNQSVYFSVILQSLLITSLALLMALLASWILLPLLSTFVPQITLVVTTKAILQLCVIAFFVALVAALIPAHLVARVDPLTAFKG